MTAQRSIWQIREVGSTGSTNTDLLRSAELGEIAHRAVLRTDHQTAGRGRVDRQWDAPPGANLLASMYLDVEPERAGEMMHRVGLAVVDAVKVPIGPDVPLGLKWPNDVLLGGRKLCGVLAQRSGGMSGVVVGFGVNVAWAPDGAACLHDHATTVAPKSLLDAVLAAFDALPDDIATLYRSRLLTLGHRVRVELPNSADVAGKAVDVDAQGRLIVRTDAAELRTFDVGDVVHLRPDDGPPVE